LIESLDSLGGVCMISSKLLFGLGCSPSLIDSLESLEGLEGVGAIEGLGAVRSASSRICRIGETGLEIWNVEGMTVRRFFGPGLRRSGTSSLVFAILSHPSQMGLLGGWQV
jgi:hypothetical protein